jgi:hypothetical protein
VDDVQRCRKKIVRPVALLHRTHCCPQGAAIELEDVVRSPGTDDTSHIHPSVSLVSGRGTVFRPCRPTSPIFRERRTAGASAGTPSRCRGHGHHTGRRQLRTSHLPNLGSAGFVRRWLTACLGAEISCLARLRRACGGCRRRARARTSAHQCRCRRADSPCGSMTTRRR